MPGYIELCLRTIRKVYPDVRELDFPGVSKLGDFLDLWRDFRMRAKNVLPSHSGDFVRAFLLARYGGLVMDADFVALQDLRLELDLLSDFYFMEECPQGIWKVAAGILCAHKDSSIAKALLTEVCDRFSSHSLSWHSVGASAVEAVLHFGCAKPLPRGAVRLWANTDRLLIDGDVDLPYKCSGIMLVNSKLQDIAHWSADEVLDSNTRLGKLFRKCFLI